MSASIVGNGRHRSTSIESYSSEATDSSFRSRSHDRSDAEARHQPAHEDDDEEDVRIAIAALGIMRSGSIGAGPSSSSNLIIPPPPRSSSSSSSSAAYQPHHHASAARPTPSISSVAPSLWSGPPTETNSSGTGASSPVAPSSIAPNSERGDCVDQASTASNDTSDPTFISRVSQLPYVSGGLEWYERSKASSRVVKYSAGLVESSLSTISRPLANNVQLGHLDDFACRQLDRLGTAGAGNPANGHHSQQLSSSNVDELEEDSRRDARREIHVGAQAKRSFDEGMEGFTSHSQQQYQQQQHPQQQHNDHDHPIGTEQAIAVVSRSRWQTVLVEAGGLGAAVSDESLKSLRYCLQWLLYANAHLDHQITVLRNFIASLHLHRSTTSPSSSSSADTTSFESASAAHLSQIKHDVVDTIRKAVDVVSKYAGGALPEQAKKYVRQSILSLPVKWASAMEGGVQEKKARAARSASASAGFNAQEDVSMNGDGSQLTPSMAAASTSSSSSTASVIGRVGVGAGGVITNAVLRPTEEAAERVLTFAVESLDMLKSVTQIFGDSVEKAEAWIERLRIVGIDRIRERQAAAAQYSNEEDDEDDIIGSTAMPAAPAAETGSTMKRRRGGPAHSPAMEQEADDGTSTARRKRGMNGKRADTAQMEM